MRNYRLDTSLLPQVWVTWYNSKSGRFWLNCKSGVKKTTPEPWMNYNTSNGVPSRWRTDVNDKRIPLGISWLTKDHDKIWVESNSSVKYMYMKYHADIDRLEVAAVGMPTWRKEVSRNWEFLGDRFFIGRDKTVQVFTSTSNWYYLYKGHTAYSSKETIRMLLRLNIYYPAFLSEFKKFIGADYFMIGNGSTIAITGPWDLAKWYETCQKTRGKGKQQKLTDDLTAIELSNSDGLAEKYPAITTNERWTKTIKDIIYFERVNDEWSVLRSFIRDEDNNLSENWRVYIGDNGTTRVTSKSHTGWVPSRHMNHYRGQYNYLVNQDEAIEKCPRIKYILQSAVEDLRPESMTDFIIVALRFPEVEQLTKLGYSNLAKRITNSNTPKAALKEIFGGYFNEKEKSLYRKTGLNKFQFDFYMNYAKSFNYNYNQVLTELREIFGNDLSHIDNESFKKYYRACERMRQSFWRHLKDYTERLNIDNERFFKNLMRLEKKSTTVYQVVKDTFELYKRLDADRLPELDWYFDDFSDLTRIHNALTEMVRIQNEEHRARWSMEAAERLKKEDERRVKLDEKRKCYEFEDAEFTIRLPKGCNEIVQEGVKQRICIGSYTSRHSTGDTNLFFLRQNNDPDTPFYAIEMNNDKKIVQIHGFGNKWLGNNPEAIPTVIRWCRKNGIKCDTKKLTCKATGYRSCNDYVPMPVVD